MITEYPPRSDRRQEFDRLLGVFRTVVPTREGTYVSAPITTGRRFVDWRAAQPNGFDWSDPQHRADHRKAVIEPNVEEVRHLVEFLRNMRRLVIDPTSLPDQAGWEQADYLLLWQSVIEEFAATVVFAEGWQHSNGCAFEFLVATRARAKTLDHTLSVLDARRGLELLNDACLQARNLDLQAPFREAVARDLSAQLGTHLQVSHT